MGKFVGTHIAEHRQYENPSDPVNSNFSVIFEITVPDAVIDPSTGKKLSETISEQTAEITAAKKAAENASNAIGNLSEHNHDDRYYTESEVDSKLSNKADSSHTHFAADISDLPTSLPANGGNASTVGGAAVMTTAALGLHKMASGTAAATSSNCPPGAWYGQYE